jgi:hypothetical protein
MRLFLPDEKIWQAQFKVNSPYFSDEAKQDGKFGEKLVFILPAVRNRTGESFYRYQE